MPIGKKVTATVKGRLLSKNLAQRLEEVANDEPPREEPVEDFKVREEPKQISRSVVIMEKPREAMVSQYISVKIPSFNTEFHRLGVDRLGGSLFHCILRAIYPPYIEWDVSRRLRKVKEFRQDLSVNFDGFYHRIDQKNNNWPSLPACKKDLETSDGAIQYDYLDYIGKIVNKCILVTTVTNDGILKHISGTRVYGKQLFNRGSEASRHEDLTTEHTKSSSPIAYTRTEPMYIIIIHLGGPAYELLCLRKDGSKFTLFPESHGIVRYLTKSI